MSKVLGHYSYLQQETKTAVLNQLHQYCVACNIYFIRYLLLILLWLSCTLHRFLPLK
ncbi:hypothetical protein PROPEN_04072 [Proteus penneri ATCC 35198]|nr:hypothetical protein PROPEN_04072 [Proteus penneri ATCC 35198]